MDIPAQPRASLAGAGVESTGGDTTVEVARARTRWRAAAESLFPTLVADPAAYAGAVEAIGAVATGLGRRDAQLEDLADAMADPEGLLTELEVRVPPGVPLPLLVAVACGMRERELIATQVRRARSAAVDRARASGQPWAVLQGPERIEDLTGGGAGGPAGCTFLHHASGTELRATVDAWSPQPFRIDVIPSGGATPISGSFTERAAWLAEFHRVRAELDRELATELGAVT